MKHQDTEKTVLRKKTPNKVTTIGSNSPTKQQTFDEGSKQDEVIAQIANQNDYIDVPTN
tara:strand:+ start:272 stop:448 length:177 start_codon:yes stop_codon:yes gene_type:complete